MRIYGAVFLALMSNSALAGDTKMTIPPFSTSPECEKLSNPLSVGNSQAFYDPNLTYKDTAEDSGDWKVTEPISQGLEKSILDRAALHMAEHPSLEISSGENKGKWSSSRPTSLIVIRNGHPVYEKYFHGDTSQMSRNIHSASKSILSAAIGIALEKGLIKSVHQKISELLPEQFQGITDPAKKNIRLLDLLTMRGGLEWEEDKSEKLIQAEPNWGKAILSRPLSSVPGKEFRYNTGLTHLLSMILTRASGMSTCDFVNKNIFGKIGITVDHWARDPQGYFSGGYDVYMTPRELAKFGMLILKGGKWKKSQILPKHWVEQATQPQTSAHSVTFKDREFSYGFNWWIRKIGGHEVAYAWGWGGQFIYVIKDLRMVVVMTADTNGGNEFIDEFDGDSILEKDVLAALKRRR